MSSVIPFTWVSFYMLLMLMHLSSPIAYAGGAPGPAAIGSGDFNDCGPNSHFDSGNAGANYSNNENITETYCSSVSGDCIRFDFILFDTEANLDVLRIFDGANINAPLIGAFSGNQLPNGGTISSSSGCLTFVWSSDGSVTRTGWQARYSCSPCPVPTCNDGIQNQGETGIDCGGPCPACGLNHNMGTGNYTTCVGNVFDSGGSIGDYGNNELFSETYCSNIPGDCISINFSSFSTEACCDFLNIYDGPNNTAPLIGTYSGTNSPGLVSATGTCLTFEWGSDGSVFFPGWAASVVCGACATCTDGILNGLEVGIDCGGPTCPPCPCSSLPVINDEACCATPVTVNPDQLCGTVSSGTVLNATPSFNSNTCFGTDDDDVWFSFVATNTTHYVDILTVVGSSTDMYHAVYGGTCNATGASLICNDLNSSVINGLTVGNTYYIRVYTWTAIGGQNTTFDVCVGSPPPPPSNDEPCNAIVASVNPDFNCNLLTPGYCVGATQTQVGCVGFANDDVWFRFTALSSEHDVSILNPAGTTDMVHEVFSGNCNALVSIGCSDPNTSSYSGLTIGSVYFVRVFTFSPFGNNTSFDLCINSPCGLAATPPDCSLNYSHSTTTYNPQDYTTGTNITFSDDRFADNFTPLGFDFCFDGTTYQDVMVSSNGYLIFPGCYSSHVGNSVLGGGYSPYSISAAAPNAFNAPLNAVMGPWQDINPSIGGSAIRTRTYGTAPNRVFVAKFFTVGMFSCVSMDFTGQIMLFESSNNIEVHIGEKGVCNSFNGGAAILGLNNYDGSSAVVPTGYNYPNQWSVLTNAPEGHRFVCNCDPAICLTILPMDLDNFSGTKNNTGNLLEWSTFSEKSAAYFVVEKSTNGYSFYEIGKVDAVGNSSAPKSYQFLDPSLDDGHHYYRLRMVDERNKVAYSKIITLSRKTFTDLKVYPNPLDNELLNIQLVASESIESVRLYNSLGQATVLPSFKQQGGQYQYQLKGFPSGHYTLLIALENGAIVHQKIVLQ